MSSTKSAGRIQSTLRQFLDNEASGGIVLMIVAVLAIVTANSRFAEDYFRLLHIHIGPLSLQHWINNALMSVFFLLVGLEIKREALDGRLARWSRRILPGAAAAGGMLVPALLYIYFNWNDPAALRGWAIPTATDIAFALGVLSLFGNRIPASLRIFLTALAMIDDLGAVVVIAIFYTAELNLLALSGAGILIGTLIIFNRLVVKMLWPYLVLGAVLWVLVVASGIHATVAGVLVALTVPMKRAPGRLERPYEDSPLHKLEHHLQVPVAFVIVPIFGFANAGVSFASMAPSVFSEPLPMGVAVGLMFGKLVGVLGTVAILVRLGLADLPARANWGQMTGVALLCGIGFTMSLFIGFLAFDDPSVQDRVKIGILIGSIVSAAVGAIFLTAFRRRT